MFEICLFVFENCRNCIEFSDLFRSFLFVFLNIFFYEFILVVLLVFLCFLLLLGWVILVCSGGFVYELDILVVVFLILIRFLELIFSVLIFIVVVKFLV